VTHLAQTQFKISREIGGQREPVQALSELLRGDFRLKRTGSSSGGSWRSAGFDHLPSHVDGPDEDNRRRISNMNIRERRRRDKLKP
jgi:hypothetical protein